MVIFPLWVGEASLRLVKFQVFVRHIPHHVAWLNLHFSIVDPPGFPADMVLQENDPGVVELLRSGLAVSADCGLEGGNMGGFEGSNLNSSGESQKDGNLGTI